MTGPAPRSVQAPPREPSASSTSSRTRRWRRYRNATVHAFLVLALSSRPDGHMLYWAIYVKPVGALTGLYMALIDPFRRWIVYPALIAEMQDAWARAYA